MASTPDFQGGAVVPFVTHAVAAGFASPAQDFLEERVDLDRELIENELTTFYIRVAGTSMTGAGIDDGDILREALAIHSASLSFSISTSR